MLLAKVRTFSFNFMKPWEHPSVDIQWTHNKLAHKYHAVQKSQKAFIKLLHIRNPNPSIPTVSFHTSTHGERKCFVAKVRAYIQFRAVSRYAQNLKANKK